MRLLGKDLRTFQFKGADMGDKGKKDIGKREDQKKPKLTIKEKRKRKKEKKEKGN
jgi:hypothetical protein